MITIAVLGGVAIAAWSSHSWWPFAKTNAPEVTPTTTAGDGATAPTQGKVGTAQRQKEVTVAQSGAGDCRSIGEALRRVAPGGTVRILDAGEYHESLQVDDSQQLAGVRLLASQNPKVKFPRVGTLVTIQAIPRFEMSCLTLVVPQAQIGLEVRGDCPGLVVSDLTIQRIPNTDGTDISSAALALRKGAAGTAEEPVVVRDVTLLNTNVGLVIGTASVQDPPVRNVVIEKCRVRGLDRNTSTLLALVRRSEDVVLRNNLFQDGMTGLSFLADGDALPIRCLIVHNTWFHAKNWLVWAGPAPSEHSLQIQHCLVVNSTGVSPLARAVLATDSSLFRNNVAVRKGIEGNESLEPFTSQIDDFPLLSLDPQSPDFMRPDFARLAERPTPLNPVPGWYTAPTQ